MDELALRRTEVLHAELVQRAQRGERDAFGELYKQYAPLVHGILLANGDRDDVEDLVQEVFLTAMHKLDTLRDRDAFGAWISTIARNAQRMSQRRALKLVPLDDNMPQQTGQREAGMDGATVLAAIRSLPEAYRETLVLRLVEGLSGAEIAARTGLSAGSVRVNLHRGMAMLRKKLGGTGT